MPRSKHLQRDVEALRPHGIDETVDCLLVADGTDRRAHTRHRRHHGHAAHRSGPATQEAGMPLFAEQDDVGIRIALLQGVQGRQGEDKVADGVRPQHGDLADRIQAHCLAHSKGST